jgi:hypothetical protein
VRRSRVVTARPSASPVAVVLRRLVPLASVSFALDAASPPIAPDALKEDRVFKVTRVTGA